MKSKVEAIISNNPQIHPDSHTKGVSIKQIIAVITWCLQKANHIFIKLIIYCFLVLKALVTNSFVYIADNSQSDSISDASSAIT